MNTDPRAPGADAAPGDLFIDGLLLELLPAVEKITTLDLYPTYSYFRVYKHGDVLVKHTDRPSCEITVSVCLGYEGPSTWPLMLEVQTGTSSIGLEPGDALIYRGTEIPHWREPMNGERGAQAFLHYVDQAGSYAEWKYDKRRAIPTINPFRDRESLRNERT